MFAAGLAVLAALYYWTSISRVALLSAAFILTRPLGATVGDFLDKPVSHGGLALSRPLASAVIAVFIVGCLLLLPQRAGRHPEEIASKKRKLRRALSCLRKRSSMPAWIKLNRKRAPPRERHCVTIR